MKSAALVLCLLCSFPVEAQADEPAGKLELVEVRKIWDQAPHNAFTDLLRHRDRWYCVFREGKAHVSPDGALRVLTSTDGEKWESLALVQSPKYDLRDAKLCVTPDGRLMLNGAGMLADQEIRYYSMSWFSEDGGKTWTEPYSIGDPGFWLWRVQWHGRKAYSMGYSTERDRMQRKLRLYRSDKGEQFETLLPEVNAPAGCGEDTMLFLKDQTALCLLRHETGDKLAQLGAAKPPYTEWTWRNLNHRIGGPNMLQLPDGRILAAVRLYDGGQRTSLCWLDSEQAKLTEALRLPSGGDTSYAGLVMHNGLLWVSYYSSHEGKASIYLAKVKVPPPALDCTEDVTFRAECDGSEQKYVLMRSSTLDLRQPVTLLIALHGHGSDRWQFIQQTRGECQAVRDVAAAYGLLLVSPDYRAKTSWMGPQAEADLLQIIRSLRKQYPVSRVIVSGGSMGGTGALTFAALHPDEINGVVSLNGTADLVSYTGFPEAIAASFGGSRTEVPEEYRRRSALFFPQKFTMPLAATTGGKDTVVPPASVLKLLEEVQKHNPQVLNLHRPEGGHSTTYEDSRQALEFVITRCREQ